MSTSGNRDRTVERWLRARGLAADADPSACPDAETLAIFIEDRLTPAERDRVESHAAGCGRCQTILATLGRTVPLPAREPGWAWLFWPGRRTLRWLVPAGAAATALALYVAVGPAEPPATRQSARPVATDARSVARSEERESSGSKRNAAGPQARNEPAPRPEAAVRLEAPDRLAKQLPVEKSERSSADPRRNRASGARRDERFLSDTRRPTTPPASVAREAEAAAVAPPVAGSAADPSASPQREARAKTSAKPDAAADTSTAQPGTPPGDPVAVGAGADRAAHLEEQHSADAAALWRAGPGADVARSIDGGRTWQTLPTGAPRDLTAVSGPTSSIAWAVGRAGIVVLTTDGRRWTSCAVPAEEDLVAVTAQDALRATVTTAAGRRFSTTDGGRTWTRVQ